MLDEYFHLKIALVHVKIAIFFRLKIALPIQKILKFIMSKKSPLCEC